MPDMPDPSAKQQFVLLPETFAVCRLDPVSPIPSWPTQGSFWSISRSADELSIVCPEDAVPDEIRCERGWRCLHVGGTLPFSAVGILESITFPLARAGISVFAISTFDTDYLLVRGKDLTNALEALRQAGHRIV
jgi:hypothetical protein